MQTNKTKTLLQKNLQFISINVFTVILMILELRSTVVKCCYLRDMGLVDIKIIKKHFIIGIIIFWATFCGTLHLGIAMSRS